jgi:hypothetical protein
MPLEAAAMSDFTYPNPTTLIRRAVRSDPPLPTPSATDAIGRTVRTDVPLPDDISEVELTQYQLERELRDARDRVRHLDQTLHCVFTVVKPCAGNGAGR